MVGKKKFFTNHNQNFIEESDYYNDLEVFYIEGFSASEHFNKLNFTLIKIKNLLHNIPKTKY
jgi:hypothetical protein